jgi:hypothetical protein
MRYSSSKWASRPLRCASRRCRNSPISSGWMRSSHSSGADLGGGAAEHLLPARGEVDPVVPQVPVEEAVVGAADGQRVALLALPQREQRRFLLGFHALTLSRRPDGRTQPSHALLQHVVRRPRLDDVGGGLLVEGPGDHDEGRPGRDLAGQLQGGQPMVAGEVVVGQDQVERKRPERPLVVLPAGDPGERELPDMLPQLPLEKLLVAGVILQQQDGEGVIDHAIPRSLSPRQVYHFRPNARRYV